MQTTRIKGIMPKGLEVELELLGVKGTATAEMIRTTTAADMIVDDRERGAAGCRG